MEFLHSLLVIFFMVNTCCSQECRYANWWISFDSHGWSYCDAQNQYINGLWRNDYEGSDDGIYLIEYGNCCDAPYGMKDVPATCKNANWWGVLDGNHRWAKCPDGYFMNGLFRTDDDPWLRNIEEARCCKPEGLPDEYANCYKHNVWGSFDGKGLSKCNEGFYMTGIYRGDCDKLYCLEEFMCCRMKELEGTPQQADETSKE